MRQQDLLKSQYLLDLVTEKSYTGTVDKKWGSGKPDSGQHYHCPEDVLVPIDIQASALIVLSLPPVQKKANSSKGQ